MTSDRNCKIFFQGSVMESNKGNGPTHIRWSGKISLKKWHLKLQLKNEDQAPETKVEGAWLAPGTSRRPVCNKELTQQAWAAQTLHIPKNNLASDQLLGNSPCTCGLPCLITVSLSTWVGTHYVVYANNAMIYGGVLWAIWFSSGGAADWVTKEGHMGALCLYDWFPVKTLCIQPWESFPGWYTSCVVVHINKRVNTSHMTLLEEGNWKLMAGFTQNLTYTPFPLLILMILLLQ